ncbi:MAG: hypothetical protein E7313_08100 [Clostridiales bacterium]|nr:hypothetical protein [Clostridiales bacterium]
MFKLFKKLFSNSSNSVPDIFSPKYEEFLLKQYGNSDKLNNSITLLVIADTHGTLDEDEFKQYMTNKQYDICIMLGDHYNRDIDIILRYVDKSKIYGIKGNHDYDYLSDYDIPNINGNIIEINGVKILGMEGSFKYKPVDFPSFTQEESITFLEGKSKVDILVTHDKKFDYEKLKDPAHQGLIGITNYIFKNKIPIHIHGHIHEPYTKKMINGTTEYSIFGYEIIKIDNNF